MKKLLLFTLLFACLAGCASKGQTVGEDYLLHTTCTITVYETGQEDVIDGAFARARELENQLSRTVETSDLSAIGQGGDVVVGADTLAVLETALDICQRSDGALDITMGGVSDLWDFGSGSPVLPEKSEIEGELSHVSYENVIVNPENSSVAMVDDHAVLDLGAVAKGYIVDEVAAYLEGQGVTSALVNFGGTISAIGDKYGEDFSIGLQQPFYPNDDNQASQLAGVVSLAGETMVTAGTYQQCFVQENQLYHHILDPKTGYPAQTDVASATVFAESAALGDAISTACVVMGYEKAVAFLEDLGGVPAIFILEDGQVIASPAVAFTQAGSPSQSALLTALP
ncbi:MAG: FAD:protein FMN transferase [Eubacteriales bacterium]